MSASEVLERQDRLVQSLAKFFDYTTNLQCSLKEFREEFKDVFKSYDLLDVQKAYEAGLDTYHEQWLPNADFRHDIEALVNRGYLGIVFDKHPDKELREKGHVVSCYFLTEAGLDYVRSLEKNFLGKAWDKQPATTLSLIFLIINLILTIGNIGYTWLNLQ